MINTSSKAIEAQCKAQEVKQSPSTKMGSKIDEGSHRNKVIGAQQGGPDPDFTSASASVTGRFGLPIQANSQQRKPANPFDFGRGHIQPDRAMGPGLIYDIKPDDYTNDNLSIEQLNLPSIAVPDLKESVTVRHTVTNVVPAKAAATYRAVVEAPAGVRMSMEPPVITFEKGGARNATFEVTFVVKQRVQGGYMFGSLTWLDDGKHSVRIPIAVRTVIRDFVTDAS